MKIRCRTRRVIGKDGLGPGHPLRPHIPIPSPTGRPVRLPPWWRWLGVAGWMTLAVMPNRAADPAHEVIDNEVLRVSWHDAAQTFQLLHKRSQRVFVANNTSDQPRRPNRFEIRTIDSPVAPPKTESFSPVFEFGQDADAFANDIECV